MAESDPTPSITIANSGPYVVAGSVPANRPCEDAEPRPRYLLCRCGGSANKPFSDGTHWRNGFKDG